MAVSIEQEARIARLKDEIKKASATKIRYEERMRQLQHEREQLLKQLEELGVKPEQLDEEIRRLQAEIDALLQEAGSLIPPDLVR
jgi:chromosome segregation ATPase